MNERIKQLAEQAAFRQFTMPKTNVSSALEGYNGMFTEQVAIEKFAELIVQECCNVLDRAQWDKGEDWFCADGTRIIVQVKEHFRS